MNLLKVTWRCNQQTTGSGRLSAYHNEWTVLYTHSKNPTVKENKEKRNLQDDWKLEHHLFGDVKELLINFLGSFFTEWLCLNASLLPELSLLKTGQSCLLKWMEVLMARSMTSSPILGLLCFFLCFPFAFKSHPSSISPVSFSWQQKLLNLFFFLAVYKVLFIQSSKNRENYSAVSNQDGIYPGSGD